MPRVCIHLDQGNYSDYTIYLSGIGSDYSLMCFTCSRDPSEAILA
jgi:hypothetical protein